MTRLAAHPNVAVKISGLGRPGHAWSAEDNGWIVRETIALFGARRAWLFHRTAEEVYALNPRRPAPG